MALNLSRIFKGKSPVEGIVTDNVDPDELGASKTDGVKWEGPEIDATKGEIVYNGHAGLDANNLKEPTSIEYPNLAQAGKGSVSGDTNGTDAINLGDTATHLEPENGGLDTFPEEPAFDEADALFGKSTQGIKVLDAQGSGSFDQVQAQYNPKELGVDRLMPNSPGQGISESIDFPSYVRDGAENSQAWGASEVDLKELRQSNGASFYALPEVDDEVLVQFQGNNYTATDDLWKFKSDLQSDAGDGAPTPSGLNANNMNGGLVGATADHPLQDDIAFRGHSAFSADVPIFSKEEADDLYTGVNDGSLLGVRDSDGLKQNIDIAHTVAGRDGFMDEYVETGLENLNATTEARDGAGTDNAYRTAGPGGSGDQGGGFLSRLDAGRPEGTNWFVPDMDSDQSGMAASSREPAGWVTSIEFPTLKSEEVFGDSINGQTPADWNERSMGPSEPGQGFMMQDGELYPRGLKTEWIVSEAALGGPDTTEGFAADLGGAFAGIKGDEGAPGGDNARTAGPGAAGFRPNPAGDGTTQHFQAMPELDANSDGAGYIGETERNLEQKVIRDGALTDNEFRVDEGTHPGFQSAEGRNMDFELGVVGRQEFQAMPELDTSGNSVVDAADYTMWRDNLRGSTPPEGILPYIEQSNLVGGQRFNGSEDQLKTLMESLQQRGLIDTSTGEIAWAVGEGTQTASSDSEMNALVNWLRATQPEVAPGDVVAMKFEISGGTGDADMARSMGPGADGFRPNPTGDGTTEHFKSVGGLSIETEVVSPSNPGVSEDMAEIVLNAKDDTGDGIARSFQGELPPAVAQVETAIPAVIDGSTGNASKNEVSIETLENREDITDRVTGYREGGVNDTTHISFDDDGPSTFLDGIRDGGLGGDEPGTLKVEWITALHADHHASADADFDSDTDFDGLDTDVDVP